ncbi:MAG: hypothetical protein SH868_03665 [Bythopirellula sp.]|nr:hypothetical protein [Bythopirellula sp.]
MQFSQVQSSQLHVSPSQSHDSHVQLSPQQQLLAAESAETVLKPKTEAPANKVDANNLKVIDI